MPKTGTILKGTVFSYGSDSSAVIATKIGILALENNVKLPDLTPVTVKITDVRLPTLLERDPLPAERNTWTILNHALETLKQTDEAAYDAFKAVLPQAGNKLPALMISFMQAAVREGATVRSWLGEANIAALQKTASGQQILKRLEREFSTSAKKPPTDKTFGKDGTFLCCREVSSNPFLCFCNAPRKMRNGAKNTLRCKTPSGSFWT